jgi:uncharacterized membrane protein YoaK (UPF0700 family)
MRATMMHGRTNKPERKWLRYASYVATFILVATASFFLCMVIEWLA